MLLRLISWPYLKRHLTRTALTVAGIVLGVAVFVGMHTANRSVIAGFGRTVDQIAGATELQITLGDAGFPESVLERVQGGPGGAVIARDERQAAGPGDRRALALAAAEDPWCQSGALPGNGVHRESARGVSPVEQCQDVTDLLGEVGRHGLGLGEHRGKRTHSRAGQHRAGVERRRHHHAVDVAPVATSLG